MSIDIIANESIRQNILRKSEFIDVVSYHEGIPLFTWIDINPTELCNRKCVFCPRADEGVYPNQKLHMSLDLAESMSGQLAKLNFKGAVTMSGYGEPLLHPEFASLCHKFVEKGIKVEVVTNGDKLSSDYVNEIIAAGDIFFVISMYDGEHQIKEFTDVMNSSKLPSSSWILRDRWYAEEKDFGLKLTNRAGVQKIRKDDFETKGKPCFYPSYSMMVDWNGDVLLCVQDWNKRVKFGNLTNDSIWDVWSSSYLNRFRKNNIRGERKFAPCNTCSANGCVHGGYHAEAFAKV